MKIEYLVFRLYIFSISEEIVKWLSVQNSLQQWKSVLGGWQSVAMGLLRQLANGLHLVSYHAYYLTKNLTLVVYFIVTMTSSTAFLSSLCSSAVLIACFYLSLYHLSVVCSPHPSFGLSVGLCRVQYQWCTAHVEAVISVLALGTAWRVPQHYTYFAFPSFWSLSEGSGFS